MGEGQKMLERSKETRNELQVRDQGSSGGSGHKEDWHGCSMIGKAHPIEEQRPKL